MTMIQGDNFTINMENKNLPVLYNGGLPSVIETKKIRKPWFNKKIISVKWNDFFEIEQNKMRVFKITPHINVSNHHNRHLWSTLHKAYELYHSTNSRTDLRVSNGLKITHREKDLIWFDIIFKTNGDNRKVEFYFSTTETMAKKFKSILEQRLNITCEEAKLVDLEIPEENTIVNELRYMKHDIFSLDTNHNTQTTPIGSILNTVNEMESGDFARISICNEREDRKKWFSNAVWASKKVKKGITPQRANISGKRIVDGSKPIVIGFVNELGSLIVDTLQAVSNAFTKESKPIEKKPIIEVEKAFDASTMKNKEKVNLSTWKTHIRTAVHSPVKFNRDNISNTIISPFGELSHDNELQAKNIRDTIYIKVGSFEIKVKGRKSEIIQELNTLRMSKKTKFDPNPNIVSSDEIGKLIQMPTAELQRKFAECLKTNKRTLTELPRVFLDKTGIYSGVAYDGKNIPFDIFIPTKDKDFLFTPRAIIGSPRMGKDQQAINHVVEAKRKHGIGSVIIDVINEQNGHRGMSDAIRDHLESEDVIDLNLMDTNNPIYLGLQGVVQNIEDKRIAGDRIGEEITSFLMSGEEDKAQTIDFLREAAKVSMGDFQSIKQMFLSEKFRNEMIKKHDNTFDMSIWHEFNKMTEQRQGQIYAPIMRRLGQLSNSEFLKPIFLQNPNMKVDLYNWIKESKVVIFRLKSGFLSERVIELLCYWITLNVFLIKLIQGGTSNTFFVLNEPHQFLSDGLVHFMERMLSEAPKYKLSPIFIFHNFSQFKKYPAFVEMLLSSSLNWHIFKNTNKGVYDKLMPYLKDTFTDAQHAFDSTKRFQFISVWLNSQGEYEPAFVCDALPMVTDRYTTKDHSFLTLRHSKMYGTPINEVLKGIKERNKKIV